MDGDLKRRIERLEQPAAEEANWEAQAEARERVSELTAMVREHMAGGPDEQMSVMEYVMTHAPEEPRSEIERVMFILKDGIQRAKERRARVQ